MQPGDRVVGIRDFWRDARGTVIDRGIDVTSGFVMVRWDEDPDSHIRVLEVPMKTGPWDDTGLPEIRLLTAHERAEEASRTW